MDMKEMERSRLKDWVWYLMLWCSWIKVQKETSTAQKMSCRSYSFTVTLLPPSTAAFTGRGTHRLWKVKYSKEDSIYSACRYSRQAEESLCSWASSATNRHYKLMFDRGLLPEVVATWMGHPCTKSHKSQSHQRSPKNILYKWLQQVIWEIFEGLDYWGYF